VVRLGARRDSKEHQRWNPHPNMMRRRIVPWMEIQRKGKGIHPIPNLILVMVARRRTYQRLNFFHYHEMEHYAMKCLHNKASNKLYGVATGEAITSQFKLDFTLIAFMVASMMGSVWYLVELHSI